MSPGQPVMKLFELPPEYHGAFERSESPVRVGN